MGELFDSSAVTLPRAVAGTLFTQSATRNWQTSGTAGFLIKPLYEDDASGQRTWLMKFEPGAYAPAHTHEMQEQVFILEGSFSDGENTYQAGDFLVRAAGVSHIAHSNEGALVLLIYSR